MRSSCAEGRELEIIALELADAEHSADNEADDEEQEQVCQQAVDAEHDKNSGIVAGEVAQVVVYTALDFTKVGGLGNALDIEELGDGPQVGKARGDGGAAQTVEAAREVHSRRQGVDRDAEA